MTTCIDCGAKSNKNYPGRCKKCSMKFREYIRVCDICKKEFKGANNKQMHCNECVEKLRKCADCGIQISKNRAIRCNSCNRKHVAASETHKAAGWARYSYGNKKYRSTWEVEAAKLMDELGISFEYEKFDKETKTRPDFWIPSIGRYLEIHPDVYGPKKPVKDCVIAKTPQQARSMIYAMGLVVANERTRKALDQMSVMQLKVTMKNTEKTAQYILGLIKNRDSKCIET